MFEYGFNDDMTLQQMSDGLRIAQECDWCPEKATITHGGERYCRGCWSERHPGEGEGLSDQEHAERQYNKYGPDGGV